MTPIKSPRKKAPQPSAKSAGQAGQKKASSFLKSLPESVEHIEIVQQVACVLEELQKRVLDVKAEASKELKKLMKRYENNYKGIEKKVHEVTSDAKKQAQTSMIQLLQKWHEHKEKLPAPLAKEIEKIIDQIGAKMVSRAAAKRPTRKVRTIKSSIKPTGRKPPSIKSLAKPVTSPKRRVKAASIAPKVKPMASPDDKPAS